jgi:hypothetical protein
MGWAAVARTRPTPAEGLALLALIQSCLSCSALRCTRHGDSNGTKLFDDSVHARTGAGPDGIEDPGERQLLLTAFALAVAGEIEAERRYARLGQAGGEAAEKPAS